MSLDKLIEGFRAFRTSYFEDSNHYEDLVRNGQSPDILVIACSDSRNDPALLTQSEPGDIFVVRNVAAIVPPYEPDGHYHGTSAAIEFAIKGLKVKHVVVLGHALCGGVQALADQIGQDAGQFEFLAPWIGIGTEARDTVDRLLPTAPRRVKLQALEQAIILTSLNNLMGFGCVQDRIKDGTLTLHGWYFDLVHGALLGYDFAKGDFAPVESASVESTPSGMAKPSGCCDHTSIERLVKSYL